MDNNAEIRIATVKSDAKIVERIQYLIDHQQNMIIELAKCNSANSRATARIWTAQRDGMQTTLRAYNKHGNVDALITPPGYMLDSEREAFLRGVEIANDIIKNA